MRILHIIETLRRAGAEQALVNLLPALQNRGIKCEVAVLCPPYTLASELEQKGILIHYLNMAYRWVVFQNTFKLAKLLTNQHFDIVHAHLFFANLYTALSGSLAPSPQRVVSFHNLAYASHPANTLWKKIRKQINSWLVRYCTQSQIAVSTAVAQHYSNHLNLQDIKVIPNAFPMDSLRPILALDKAKIRAHYNISSDEFLIIVPGRLIPEKNHNVLLQAIKILKEQNLHPRVLILGDGPLKEEINRILVIEKLSDQVILHQAIPHEELMQIVQAADIFVMPSSSEGFGLAPAEAMALETPVICSKIGGLTDLIENEVSGILVPSGDAKTLAKAIASVMKTPTLREQLGKAGRKRIEICFNVETIADRYVQYYKQIVENKTQKC
jgi:glycosyltransferase involved in cell wall biosynthesis